MHPFKASSMSLEKQLKTHKAIILSDYIRTSREHLARNANFITERTCSVSFAELTCKCRTLCLILHAYCSHILLSLYDPSEEYNMHMAVTSCLVCTIPRRNITCIWQSHQSVWSLGGILHAYGSYISLYDPSEELHRHWSTSSPLSVRSVQFCYTRMNDNGNYCDNYFKRIKKVVSSLCKGYICVFSYLFVASCVQRYFVWMSCPLG